MAVDFNKRLKTDRIKLFVDVVTKMANDTPAGGYAIGEAIGRNLCKEFRIMKRRLEKHKEKSRMKTTHELRKIQEC